MPKIDFINDKAGKPIGIYQHIGRRPILVFGNSDGDMQMIEYATAGKGRRLELFVHHTDADFRCAGPASVAQRLRPALRSIP